MNREEIRSILAESDIYEEFRDNAKCSYEPLVVRNTRAVDLAKQFYDESLERIAQARSSGFNWESLADWFTEKHKTAISGTFLHFFKSIDYQSEKFNVIKAVILHKWQSLWALGRIGNRLVSLLGYDKEYEYFFFDLPATFGFFYRSDTVDQYSESEVYSKLRRIYTHALKLTKMENMQAGKFSYQRFSKKIFPLLAGSTYHDFFVLSLLFLADRKKNYRRNVYIGSLFQQLLSFGSVRNMFLSLTKKLDKKILFASLFAPFLAGNTNYDFVDRQHFLDWFYELYFSLFDIEAGWLYGICKFLFYHATCLAELVDCAGNFVIYKGLFFSVPLLEEYYA